MVKERDLSSLTSSIASNKSHLIKNDSRVKKMQLILSKQPNSMPMNTLEADKSQGLLKKKTINEIIEPNYLNKIRQYCSFETISTEIEDENDANNKI